MYYKALSNASISHSRFSANMHLLFSFSCQAIVDGLLKGKFARACDFIVCCYICNLATQFYIKRFGKCVTFFSAGVIDYCNLKHQHDSLLHIYHIKVTKIPQGNYYLCVLLTCCIIVFACLP